MLASWILQLRVKSALEFLLSDSGLKGWLQKLPQKGWKRKQLLLQKISTLFQWVRVTGWIFGKSTQRYLLNEIKKNLLFPNYYFSAETMWENRTKAKYAKEKLGSRFKSCSTFKSEIRSVVSNCLWPYGLYTVHGVLQARILKWVAFLISRRSSHPRNRTQVSCIAGRFFTSWVTREAPKWKWKAFNF